MPPLGVAAAVEVFPEYAAGLLHLEKHSHLWVLAWLEKAERDVLQVTPRGVADRGPAGLHGVFAVRSPARPNPVGLTAARILRREGTLLHLERLDFLDGTPVIDLKPYFLSRDLVLSATNASIGRPADREAMRQSLLYQAVNFHGELCAGLALGVRLVEHFRAEALALAGAEHWEVAAPLARACLLDALMALTRATPGRRNLRLVEEDRVAFSAGGAARHYDLLLPAEAADPAAVFAAADAALFAAL